MNRITAVLSILQLVQRWHCEYLDKAYAILHQISVRYAVTITKFLHKETLEHVGGNQTNDIVIAVLQAEYHYRQYLQHDSDISQKMELDLTALLFDRKWKEDRYCTKEQ